MSLNHARLRSPKTAPGSFSLFSLAIAAAARAVLQPGLATVQAVLSLIDAVEDVTPDDGSAWYCLYGAVKSGRVRPEQRGNLWAACRVGDEAHVSELLAAAPADVEATLNARDRWDSSPLYYAALGGHSGCCRLLLEAGALCDEASFDGDRVHYAALTLSIRELLRAYEARPPPLSPLAAALRAVLTGPAAEGQPPQSPAAASAPLRPLPAIRGPWVDVALAPEGGPPLDIPRWLLAARSPRCRRLLIQHPDVEQLPVRACHEARAAFVPPQLAGASSLS